MHACIPPSETMHAYTKNKIRKDKKEKGLWTKNRKSSCEFNIHFFLGVFFLPNILCSRQVCLHQVWTELHIPVYTQHKLPYALFLVLFFHTTSRLHLHLTVNEKPAFSWNSNSRVFNQLAYWLFKLFCMYEFACMHACTKWFGLFRTVRLVVSI